MSQDSTLAQLGRAAQPTANGPLCQKIHLTGSSGSTGLAEQDRPTQYATARPQQRTANRLDTGWSILTTEAKPKQSRRKDVLLTVLTATILILIIIGIQVLV